MKGGLAMSRILIVDGDDDTRDVLQAVLEEDSFEVRGVPDVGAAIEEMASPEAPSLVLLDASLADSPKLVDLIHARGPAGRVSIVLMSAGRGTLKHRRAPLALRKPFSIELLLEVAEAYCKRRS